MYLCILVFFLLVGIIYTNLNFDSNLFGSDFLSNINLFNVERMVVDISILALATIFSVIGLGFIILVFFLIYHAFLTGVTISIFINVLSIKGIVISLLYFIFYKLLLFLILFVIYVLVFKMIKIFYKKIVLKEEINNLTLLKIIRKICVLIIILFIYYVSLLFINHHLISFFVGLST